MSGQLQDSDSNNIFQGLGMILKCSMQPASVVQELVKLSARRFTSAKKKQENQEKTSL